MFAQPDDRQASGGPLTSYTYDGLGEAVTTYDGYAVSPATIGTAAAYAAAGSVTGDLIFEQTETQYDAAGNVILVTSRPIHGRLDGHRTADDLRFAGLLRRRLV